MAAAPDPDVAGDRMHAVLSWAPLVDRRSALSLVAALVQAMSIDARAALHTMLADRFRSSLLASMDDTHGRYAPARVPVTVRYAAYSLNLFLLLLAASPTPVPVRGLVLNTRQPFDEWRRHSGL